MVRPCNVMLPVAELQPLGLLNDVVVIAGVGFTTTFTVDGRDGQPFTVAVTEYVPAPAIVILGMFGF